MTVLGFLQLAHVKLIMTKGSPNVPQLVAMSIRSFPFRIKIRKKRLEVTSKAMWRKNKGRNYAIKMVSDQ